MELTEAYNHTRYLMDEHGLKDWVILIEDDPRYHGVCRYRERCITLQDSMIINATCFNDMMPTVLHEIAHALTPGHSHDKVWAKKVRELIAFHVFGRS